MKNSFKLWAACAVVGLVAAGCVKESSIEGNDPVAGNGEGALTISIAPSNPGGTRALLGPSTDAVISAFEQNIEDFTVYLFDETGAFLEQKVSAPGATELVFLNYAAGDQIQVVAFANVATAAAALPTLSDGATIADVTTGLDDVIALSTQVMGTDYFDDLLGVLNLTDIADLTAANFDSGLFMSGRYGADPYSGVIATAGDETYVVGTNTDGAGWEIEVPVSRVVSKVILGEVGFSDSYTLGELLDFDLTAAAPQMAIGSSYIYPGDINTYPTAPAPTYYGGFAGQTGGSTVLSALTDTGAEGSGILDADLISGVVETALGTPALSVLVAGVLGIVPGIDTVADLANAVVEGTLVGVADPLLSALDGIALSSLGLNAGDLIDNPANFWYVLPNSPSTDYTLLTLQGAYQGNTYFYPVGINNQGNADAVNAKGIQRNYQYTVNVTFQSKFDTGTTDPDDPTKGTNLKVTIAAAPWTEVEQDTTW